MIHIIYFVCDMHKLLYVTLREQLRDLSKEVPKAYIY